MEAIEPDYSIPEDQSELDTVAVAVGNFANIEVEGSIVVEDSNCLAQLNKVIELVVSHDKSLESSDVVVTVSTGVDQPAGPDCIA